MDCVPANSSTQASSLHAVTALMEGALCTGLVSGQRGRGRGAGCEGGMSRPVQPPVFFGAPTSLRHAATPPLPSLRGAGQASRQCAKSHRNTLPFQLAQPSGGVAWDGVPCTRPHRHPACIAASPSQAKAPTSPPPPTPPPAHPATHIVCDDFNLLPVLVCVVRRDATEADSTQGHHARRCRQAGHG